MAESFTVDKMRPDPSDPDLIIGKKMSKLKQYNILLITYNIGP